MNILLGLVLRWVLPGLGAIAVIAILVLALQNRGLRQDNATLVNEAKADAAEIKSKSDQIAVLQDGINRRNAEIARQSAEGRARMDATSARLDATPDAELPAGFNDPLTGASACERAEEVRGRLLNGMAPK